MKVNRTVFLIDGFNIYHSIIETNKETGKNAKWLNYQSLCKSYLPHIGKTSSLEKIYYFTAHADHMINKDPDKINRHKLFISCLEDLGIVTILGRFKEKFVYCPNCKKHIRKNEEKETDVAISTKLFEIFHNNECETAVLLTGDTDIVPAIKTVKKIFKDKKIAALFPYKRKNEELKTVCDLTFSIKKDTYSKFLFDDPYIKMDGKTVPKPVAW